MKSGIFEEVMVSTDDAEVVQIAKQYGASVPFLRSEETANDYAQDVDTEEDWRIAEFKYQWLQRNK